MENLIYQARQLEELIRQLSSAVSEAPTGRLRIAHSHGSEQYFRVMEDKDCRGDYISKKNMALVKALAQKEYDKTLLRELENVKRLFDKLEDRLKREKWMDSDGKFSEERLRANYEKLNEYRRRLIDPRVLSDRDYAEKWMKLEYQGKEFMEDAPEIYTERGERVRSKSEKMIADKLYMMRIPYRYECPLYLKGFGTVYPDFTVLNVRQRKEIYLEHFGMMDHTEYACSTVKKLNLYEKNGIYIGDRLLTTYESSSVPIDMRSVERLLEKFVLSDIRTE